MSAVAEKRAVSGLVDSEARGKAIRARRLRHGIKSVRQLAIQSGVSREAATAAEEGQASEATYERLEAWLARFEEETGADRPAETSTGPQVITIRAGEIDVIVEGPIGDPDALAALVERLRALPARRTEESEESGDQGAE